MSCFVFLAFENVIHGQSFVTHLTYQGPSGTEFLLSPIQQDCYSYVLKSLGRDENSFVSVFDLVNFCKKEAPNSNYVFVCNLAPYLVFSSSDESLKQKVTERLQTVSEGLEKFKALYPFQTKNYIEPGSLSFMCKPDLSIELTGDVYSIHYFTMFMLPDLLQNVGGVTVSTNEGEEGRCVIMKLTNNEKVNQVCSIFKDLEKIVTGYRIQFHEEKDMVFVSRINACNYLVWHKNASRIDTLVNEFMKIHLNPYDDMKSVSKKGNNWVISNLEIAEKFISFAQKQNNIWCD